MNNNKTLVNTTANLISRAWTMAANFIFVPLYILFLGEESYGLITFFATMQTVLNLLNLGFSKTLRREFASDDRSGKDVLYKYKLLRSAELIFIIICIIIIILCCFASDFIADKWLIIENIRFDTVTLTINLMGVSIGIQLIANLYLGCLFGLDKQLLANILQILWSVIKNVGVILIIAFILPDIRLFYLWHILVDVIYVIVVRFFVVKNLKCKDIVLNWGWHDFRLLKTTYRFAFGVMIISFGYAFNSQLDKIIISNQFSLTIVGAYNTAYNLSLAAVVFTSALGIAVFPKFTRFYSIYDKEHQNDLYINVNRLSNLWTSTFGAFIAIYSYDIILIWTGSPEIANISNNVAMIIILGTTISALQEIPYNYFLSCEVTIVNSIQTILCIGYVLIITPIMIDEWGIMGAAFAWLIEMILSTTIYLFIFYHKYFNSRKWYFLMADTYVPLAVNIAIAFISEQILNIFNLSSILRVTIAILIGFICIYSWLKIRLKDGWKKDFNY